MEGKVSYFPCVASCTTRKAIWFTSSLGVRLPGFRFGVDFGFFGMRPLRHVRSPISSPKKTQTERLPYADYFLGLPGCSEKGIDSDRLCPSSGISRPRASSSHSATMRRWQRMLKLSQQSSTAPSSRS